MKKKDQITITEIEGLAAGGDGVGRVNGKVCFVPYAVTGDELRVRIVQENRSLIRAEIVEITKRGPGRRDPACPIFGICGGCSWLHLDEDRQIEAKQRILSRALGMERIDFVPSPKKLGYRKIARLHFDAQCGGLGFKIHKNKTIVDLTTCPILGGDLNRAITPLKNTLLPHVAGPAEIRIALGNNGPVVLLETDQPLPAAFYTAGSAMVPDPFAGMLVSVEGFRTVVAGTEGVVVAGIDGAPLDIPISSFGQANHGTNNLLGATVRDWIATGSYRRIMELFAGAGNITTIVADSVRTVATAETDGDACLAARENLTARGLKKVTVHHGDGLDIYRRLGDKFELVVLDPPRTGHRELAKSLARGKQRAVLYISCNPATLSRDVEELRKGGYKLTKALGFDMFPQTAHIEAAVLLER
ncbi:MAG: class I SAM-dependent RNA methyltransferase [Proteobacteria bacterium]|nr:class I SAM-dependent RNA methyltransferase [Pseudomonadota bacterium]